MKERRGIVINLAENFPVQKEDLKKLLGLSGKSNRVQTSEDFLTGNFLIKLNGEVFPIVRFS
jgi:hypothetical protein